MREWLQIVLVSGENLYALLQELQIHIPIKNKENISSASKNACRFF
jgi:hypothetical protein